MIYAISLIVFLFGVLVFLYSVFLIEMRRQNKFMRLYDEMYIYYKNKNKGE